MDLSLVRKMIVARMIKSFSSLHHRVALICHNCVKFNGRYVSFSLRNNFHVRQASSNEVTLLSGIRDF